MKDRRSHRHQAGVSLVESLVVAAVAALSLGAVVPGFDDLRARRHLEGAASVLQTDIQHARSTAVAYDRPLRLTVRASAGGSCYIVHTGGADACTCSPVGPAAVCSAGEHAVRSERFAADHALRLRGNVTSIVFDAAKGTTTPTGTLQLLDRRDRAVHLVVNVMGRVRTCSPSALPGYRAC